jgi:dUTP pyrophosphatase
MARAKKPVSVKIKRAHKNAVTPTYAMPGDAGMDLTAISKNVTDKYIEYDTGLQFEIPDGYVGLLFPRSSISKTDLSLCNAVGVLDSGYRGNVTFRFNRNSNDQVTYKQYLWEYGVGDRIGQIMILPYPKVTFVESEALSETERGSGGYGSTND